MVTAAPLRDSHEGFGLVSRTFHWGMALLFVWQFTSAILHAFAEGTVLDAFFWQTHYSVGFTLFVLVLLRGLWGLANIRNRPPHAGPPFERFAATTGQVVLYAMMVVIPPLMVYRAIASGRGFRVYGLQLVAPGEPTATREALAPLATLHIYLAWTLLAFIVIHAGIALYHAYVRRDATLDRMTKGASPLPLNPGSHRY
ncbi:cytochrome b [Aureimonas psammosilenae]|uniref:cytochrome b n=1 Tax=Aureimonas psammosilenae TaxID=2495496 RepID=UPI001260DF12|nr:cytochrome b [Aureimonas psammosilenae]